MKILKKLAEDQSSFRT